MPASQNPAAQNTYPAAEGFDLGPGPHPVSDQEWQQRLRRALGDLLSQAVPSAAAEMDKVRLVVAADAAPDLRSLQVDLTGVHLTEEQVRRAGPIDELFRPAAIDERRSGRVHAVVIEAAPLLAEDIPVHLYARAENVPVQWARDAGGHLWMLEDRGTDLTGVTGEGELRVPTAKLLEWIRDRVQRELATEGVTVSAFDLTLTSSHRRSLHAVVDAKVRKGVLAASVQLTTRVSVDDQMIATVEEVQASSRNPLIGMLLRILRGRIAAFAGVRRDLNSWMPPGLRLLDLELYSGVELRAKARFG